MLKINTAEFIDYSSAAIEEFLLVSGDINFEISIPKRSGDLKNDKYFVVHEYASAAYAGQLLSGLSETFSYYVPHVENKGAFIFQLSTEGLHNLAEVLYYIIRGFAGDGADKTFLKYQINANQFLSDAYENDVECNTWGLVAVAEKFIGP